ncbi:hypothetical protein OC861_006793, partial [Tilletia horrida]
CGMTFNRTRDIDAELNAERIMAREIPSLRMTARPHTKYPSAKSNGFKTISPYLRKASASFYLTNIVGKQKDALRIKSAQNVLPEVKVAAQARLDALAKHKRFLNNSFAEMTTQVKLKVLFRDARVKRTHDGLQPLFERRQHFAVLAGCVLDHEAELAEETKAYGGDTSDENEAKEDADRTDTLAYQLKAHLPRIDTLAHVFEDVTYEIKDLRKKTMSKPHWDHQRRQERDDAFNTVFDTSHKAFGDNNW